MKICFLFCIVRLKSVLYTICVFKFYEYPKSVSVYFEIKIPRYVKSKEIPCEAKLTNSQVNCLFDPLFLTHVTLCLNRIGKKKKKMQTNEPRRKAQLLTVREAYKDYISPIQGIKAKTFDSSEFSPQTGPSFLHPQYPIEEATPSPSV